ncbi:hypothetical protein [Embleya sp. AB8]|uniref:hypothetical protein n=1 Tax=Embleya sp. AB8 TaxID=3156304 RepID=UPI003C71B619
MSEHRTTPIRVTASGNEERPIRVELSGRPPTDVTRAELVMLQHEIRMYLIRTCPAPSVRRSSNSGG